jgi:uncharacterized protein
MSAGVPSVVVSDPPWPSAWALCCAVYPQPGRLALQRRLRLRWHLWRHRGVHQSLCRAFAGPLLGELAGVSPRLFRKPYAAYPCTGLTVAQRAAHLVNHHQLAVATLGPRFLQGLWLKREGVLGGVPLPAGQGVLPLQLLPLTRFEREGDLSLVLSDPFGTALYTLTFSFERLADGRTGLFIGALHGSLPVPVARHLTKLCHGLRPQNLLLWLLQLWAARWGVARIRAVGQGRHVYAGTSRAQQVRFDYDAFWQSLGGEADGQGLFTLALQPAQRHRDDVPAHKRALYQRRYAWLDEVAAGLGGQAAGQ